MATATMIEGLEPFALRPSVDRFTLPTRMSCADWVEENVILGAVTSMPGPVSLDRTPYLREILNAFSDPDCEEITMKTGTQIGKTFAQTMMMAYAVNQDPGPALFVMPTEKLARELVDERLIPVFENSPILRKHLSKNPYDTTKLRVRFDRMDMHMAWAGSPSELSSRPKRYLFLDETNKYPPASGRESDPIKLAWERTRTYIHSRKIVKSSTPTVKGAYIHREYEASDKRQYFVPCPHCGTYQVLVWSHVKWARPEDKHPDPDSLRASGDAWYLCIECEDRIEDRQKPAMLRRGVSCPDGCQVDRQGHIIGNPPPARHRGLHIPWMYSPWLRFADGAAEFLESRHDPQLLRNYINSWLAEEWEDPTKSTTLVVDSMPEGAVELMHLPEDTIILLAASDVQGDHVWYVVRAWCGGEVSHLVEEGKLCPVEPDADGEGGMTDLEHLAQTVLKGTWQTPDGTEHQVRLMAVDRRYRTDEVDKFCRANVERCIGVSGANRPQAQALQERSIDAIEERKRKGKKRTGLTYMSVENDYFKVLLSRLMREGKFKASEDASAAYHRQVNSEHRVEVGSRDGKAVYEWKKKPGSHDNHLWITEVYCAAAAHYLKYFIDPEALRPREPVAQKQQKRRATVTTPDGRPYLVTER